jgi:hypothetical protein
MLRDPAFREMRAQPVLAKWATFGSAHPDLLFV